MDLYLTDPRADTPDGWKAIIDIIAKHINGSTFNFHATHDILYLPLDTQSVPEDSEDGQILIGLGCHLEFGCWVKFT